MTRTEFIKVRRRHFESIAIAEPYLLNYNNPSFLTQVVNVDTFTEKITGRPDGCPVVVMEIICFERFFYNESATDG